MPDRTCRLQAEEDDFSTQEHGGEGTWLFSLIKMERRTTYAEAVVGAAKHFCLIYKLSDYKLRMLTR